MSKSIEITGLTNDQLYGFRIFPRNLKGQYQTELDGATATATPKAFSLPTFTGQYTIFGNETEGRIEMYTSGVITLSVGTYDCFLVGGGGTPQRGAGGGGGYTTTLTKLLNGVSTLSVTIGSADGATEIQDVGKALSGYGTSWEIGNNGGSGGGGYDGASDGHCGDGGSDGSDGKPGTAYNGAIKNQGGKGQGTTTRAFGESTGTLYAGGGGGGDYYASDGVGGSGGGGSAKQNGTPNTGGGGGGSGGGLASGKGGSGIAIIRWKNI